MAQQSTEIKMLNDDEFQIVKINGDGKIKDALVYKAVEAPDDKTIGKTLTEINKKDGTYRATFQALLGHILASSRLDGFKGKGDKTTGKTSKELKAAVRDAETATIEEMVKAGHIRLNKAEDAQVQLQEFLSTLRDNKNYSNIKSYCVSYFAFVGENCITPSGRLVPQPVMQERIRAAIVRPETDKTYASQLAAIVESMGKATIGEEDAKRSLSVVKDLFTTLQGIVDSYAADATDKRAGVAKTAKDVISSAAARKASEPALV